uniref:Uncharacterized protein n=1 Tax=Cacopsylla melanoneura TaxID=428564 RepID=A0A8D9EWP4_9HEMI
MRERNPPNTENSLSVTTKNVYRKQSNKNTQITTRPQKRIENIEMHEKCTNTKEIETKTEQQLYELQYGKQFINKVWEHNMEACSFKYAAHKYLRHREATEKLRKKKPQQQQQQQQRTKQQQPV